MNTSNPSINRSPALQDTAKATVAYLSPALPALSETFVYEELLALERRGFHVIPISVHVPATPVPAQRALAERVTHLYAASPLVVAISGLARLPMFYCRAPSAVAALIFDMMNVGLHRSAAWKLAFQFLAATKLARILMKKKCSHLHVHFADTPGQIAMYASAMSGVPFTIMAHANDIYSGALLLKEKATRASKLLTISEFNCRYLESLGISRNRLAVVRCGVSFSMSGAVSRNVGGATYRIGSLGRMVEKKGFDVLLRSVAELRKRGLDVELRLAGDGPLRAELVQLAQELSITSSVVFEGSMEHSKVADWMRQLDVFVLACKEGAGGDIDGIPVVLMEAMSQSVPVISTRLSGIPELVVHGETGLLAEPGDALDLTKQIFNLLSSPELRFHMLPLARRHVLEEFSQDVNIDRLIAHIANHKK